MKEKNVEVKVGLFVLLGTLALVIAIFAISGDQALFAEQYRLKVKFTESTGLTSGSVVAVMGFPVGNVEAIDFEEESMEIMVTMKIFEKYQMKITEGSIAEVRTKGALGDKYIYITPGRSPKPIAEWGFVEASKEQDLLSVISSKGHQINKVFSILNKIDRLMDDVNGEGQAGKLMNGLSATAEELSKASKEVSRIAKQLQKEQSAKDIASSLKSLSNVLEKLDNGEGSLGALINDPSVHDNLKRILGSKSYNSTLKNVIRTSIKDSEQ